MSARHSAGAPLPNPHQHMSTKWEAQLDVIRTQVADNIGHASAYALNRQLNCVSRQLHTAAVTNIRHLSLARYGQGRRAAQHLLAQAGEPVTPAMAAAAAVPAMPWGLLAATPSLTSLDIRADQLEELMAGPGGTGTSTAVAPPSAAAEGAAAADVAAPPGPAALGTILGRLRCLRVVTGIESKQQLAHLGKLLASTTQLTRLVVKGSSTLVRRQRSRYAPPYVNCQAAREAASQASPPAATTAAGDPTAGTTSAAAAAGGGSSTRLPPLQHLVLEGPLEGPLPAWLQRPQAAAQLTALHLTRGAALHLSLLDLASGLQELTLEKSYLGAGLPVPRIMQLPRGLTRLTRLVIWDTYMPSVPPAVQHMTTLRHLALGTEYGKLAVGLPGALSNLEQLQTLELRHRKLSELPRDMGTWLPQLEELDVSYTGVEDLPRGLTRLTRLEASGTRVTQVSAVTHLVTLKELVLEGSVLKAPLQPLTQLSALETLCLGWIRRLPQEEAAQLHLPGPLPALRSLSVKGHLRLGQVQEMVLGAQQLTRLALTINLGPEEVLALGQLGALPRLQQLELSRCVGATQWGAVAPWLQQLPSLTSLKLSKCRPEGALLLQLPAQLEELQLSPYIETDGSTVGVDQPTALTQLSQLRRLSIACDGYGMVPSWLSSLRCLEVLEVTGWKVRRGWEVLAQLPALRRVTVEEQVMLCALRHAPHLCWALPVTHT